MYYIAKTSKIVPQRTIYCNNTLAAEQRHTPYPTIPALYGLALRLLVLSDRSPFPLLPETFWDFPLRNHGFSPLQADPNPQSLPVSVFHPLGHHYGSEEPDRSKPKSVQKRG